MHRRLQELAMDSSSSSDSDEVGVDLPDVGVVGHVSVPSDDGSPQFTLHPTDSTPRPQIKKDSSSSDDTPAWGARPSPPGKIVHRRAQLKQFMADSDGSEGEGAPQQPPPSPSPPPFIHDASAGSSILMSPPQPVAPPAGASTPPSTSNSSTHGEESALVETSRPSPEPLVPHEESVEPRKALLSPSPVLSPPLSPSAKKSPIPAPQLSPPPAVHRRKVPIHRASFPPPRQAMRTETQLLKTSALPPRARTSASRPRVRLVPQVRPASASVARRKVPPLEGTLNPPTGPPVKLTKSVKLRRSAADRFERQWAFEQAGGIRPLPPVQNVFVFPERQGDLYEVSLVALQRKDEKLEEIRRRAQEREHQQCSFMPSLSEGSEWLVRGMTSRRGPQEPSAPRSPPPFYSGRDKDDAVNCTFVPVLSEASRRILEAYESSAREEGKLPLPASERLFLDRERRDAVLAEEAAREQKKREMEEEATTRPLHLHPLSAEETAALVERVSNPVPRVYTFRKPVSPPPQPATKVVPRGELGAIVNRLSSKEGRPLNRHSRKAPERQCVDAPEVSAVSVLMREAQRERVMGSWYDLLWPGGAAHRKLTELAEHFPEVSDLVRLVDLSNPARNEEVATSRVLDFSAATARSLNGDPPTRTGFAELILGEEHARGPQLWTHQGPSQLIRAAAADPQFGLPAEAPHPGTPAVFRRLSLNASLRVARMNPVPARRRPLPARSPIREPKVRSDVSSILFSPGTPVVGGTRPRPASPSPNKALLSAALDLEALLNSPVPATPRSLSLTHLRARTEAPVSNDICSVSSNSPPHAYKEGVAEDSVFNRSVAEPDPVPIALPPRPTPPTSSDSVLLTLAQATYHHDIVHRPDAENSQRLPRSARSATTKSAPLAELVLGAHDRSVIERLAQRLVAKQLGDHQPPKRTRKVVARQSGVAADF